MKISRLSSSKRIQSLLHLNKSEIVSVLAFVKTSVIIYMFIKGVLKMKMSGNRPLITTLLFISRFF